MLIEIILIEFLNGDCPVQIFLDAIKKRDVKAFDKIEFVLDLFEKHPIELMRNTDFMRKLKGYERYHLWEFKIIYNGMCYRIFCSIIGNKCHLVHGFIKKKQKTDKKEIEIAISRIKQYIHDPKAK